VATPHVGVVAAFDDQTADALADAFAFCHADWLGGSGIDVVV
jgi:hypothetical protein